MRRRFFFIIIFNQVTFVSNTCNDNKMLAYFFFFSLFRFTLVKEHLIEFNQLAMANSSGSDDMLNRVMPRDNIGLAALLKTNETAWENCKSHFVKTYTFFLHCVVLFVKQF